MPIGHPGGDGVDIDTLLQEHGLWFVVLGTFIEGDAVALGAGLLQHRGVFPFWGAVGAAALGGFLSDIVIYTIGRLGRQTRPVRRLLDDRRTQSVQRRVLKRPYVLAFASRFIPATRTVIPVSIGATAAIPFPIFAGLMAVSCSLWALVIIGVGHEIGNLLHAVFGQVRLIWLLAAVAALGLAGWGLRHLWQSRMRRRGA